MVYSVSEAMRLISNVQGFFPKESACIFASLLDTQNELNVKGNLCEVGVWHGRSAAFTGQYKREDEIYYLCDISATTLRPKIAEAFQCLNIDIADPKFTLVNRDSKTLEDDETFKGKKRSCRFLHVDGLHDGNTFLEDLAFANYLCADEGIIALDDFYSPAFPSVTQVFYNYLSVNSASLTLFAVGFRKGYVCRPAMAAKYRKALAQNIHAKADEVGSPVTLHKSAPDAETMTMGVEVRGRNQSPVHGTYSYLLK